MKIKFDDAVSWMESIFKVDVKAMLRDGILKKKDVIANYKRHLDNINSH